MPFRFQAKYGLLTYPQCGAVASDPQRRELDAWDVVTHLGNLGAECIVGRESHGDGGVHLHAFFMFESKFRSSDVRVFDVDGHHPNVSRGYANPADGYDYAIKDGDVVAGGLERPGEHHVQKHSVWSRIIEAETESEFWALARELDPRAVCISFTSLRAYCGHRYAPTRAQYRSPSGIRFDTSQYPELSEWVDHELRQRTDER